MSYLYRTGNGRNNIAFTNTANSSTKYLRRTSTSRNSIIWTTIPNGSTYNILQRNGTGRNNILWSNLKIGPDTSATALQNNMHIKAKGADDGHGNTVYLTLGTMTSSGGGRIRATNFSFENNRIKYSGANYGTSMNWTNLVNDYNNSFKGYVGVVIYVESSPPSDYLSAIKSCTVINTTYNARFARYQYLNSYHGNVVLISLNSTSIQSNSEPVYINFT